jgi:hypothetical protein
MAEYCILQDYVRGGYPSSPGIRCWFTGAHCIPTTQCDERRRLSADEIALREQEDAA